MTFNLQTAPPVPGLSRIADVELAAPAEYLETANFGTGWRFLQVHFYCPGETNAGGGVSQIRVWFNADTGNNYDYQAATGVSSATNTSGILLGENAGLSEIHAYIDISNPGAANKTATVSAGGLNNAGGSAGFHAGAWKNAADELTSVRIGVSTGNDTLKAGTRIIVFGMV